MQLQNCAVPHALHLKWQGNMQLATCSTVLFGSVDKSVCGRYCKSETAWSLSAEQHRRAELEAQMLHREAAMYDPWGKGGGGAPHRSPAGQPITDLHQV